MVVHVLSQLVGWLISLTDWLGWLIVGWLVWLLACFRLLVGWFGLLVGWFGFLVGWLLIGLVGCIHDLRPSNLTLHILYYCNSYVICTEAVM